MIFERKSIFLRDGRSAVLRSAQAEDAEQALEHLRLTSAETLFMARYPEEIRMTPEMESAFLKNTEESSKDVLLTVEVGSRMAALGGVNLYSSHERFRHRAVFGLSVQKAYWGLGIGSALLSASLDCAREMGFEQVELEVAAENTRAVSLYRKYGFQIYGTREKSFLYRDGSYASEHLMMKRLGCIAD